MTYFTVLILMSSYLHVIFALLLVLCISGPLLAASAVAACFFYGSSFALLIWSLTWGFPIFQFLWYLVSLFFTVCFFPLAQFPVVASFLLISNFYFFFSTF
jgi:hypothetical protein